VPIPLIGGGRWPEINIRGFKGSEKGFDLMGTLGKFTISAGSAH
jgi:hypothetical protein